MKIPGDKCDENGMDEKYKRKETKLKRNCPDEEEFKVKVFENFRKFEFSGKLWHVGNKRLPRLYRL